MADTTTATGPSWTALWARPRYRGFVITVLLSRIVGGMFNTAGVLLVLARTGSAVLAGVVAAAAVIPAAFTGPVLGAWLDIARRRRVLVVADQLLSAVTLTAMVAAAGHAPDWTLPLIAVLYSVTRPFSTGSFSGTLSALAGEQLLDLASSIEATSLNLAILVGPAIAGGLTAVAGAGRVIELQVMLTLVVAAAVAANPAFEARVPHALVSLTEVMRVGTRALFSHRLLREISAASMLAAFTWGLMVIAFPLYAAHDLHVGRDASGYLWAAVALGSMIGTFALAGAPSRPRVAGSYLALGLSALLWRLAGSLPVGFGLITLTGFLEGPAYAGSIALRQRHAPIGARTQVLNTITGINQVAFSAGAVLGGVLHATATVFLVFVAVNLLAAAIAVRPDR